MKRNFNRISVVLSPVVLKIGEEIASVLFTVVVVVVVSFDANAAFLLTTSTEFAAFTAEHRAFHVATRHAAADQTHFRTVQVVWPSDELRAEEQQTNQHPRPSGHHRVGRFVDALFAFAQCSFRHFISVRLSFRISSSLEHLPIDLLSTRERQKGYFLSFEKD